MLATVPARSRPFAQTTCLQRLRVGRANASEPERTPSAAIAAIVIVPTRAALRRRAAGRSQVQSGGGMWTHCPTALRTASPRVANCKRCGQAVGYRGATATQTRSLATTTPSGRNPSLIVATTRFVRGSILERTPPPAGTPGSP